jgi:hypothetical protein
MTESALNSTDVVSQRCLHTAVRKTFSPRYPSAESTSRPNSGGLNSGRDRLAHNRRDRHATKGDPFCVWAVALWMPTLSYRTLSEMVVRRVRVLLKIGDTMRVLCCLLLVWSTLLSGCSKSNEDASGPKNLDETVTLDADAQTTKESRQAPRRSRFPRHQGDGRRAGTSHVSDTSKHLQKTVIHRGPICGRRYTHLRS